MTNDLKNLMNNEVASIPPMADCVDRVVAMGTRRSRQRRACFAAAAAVCLGAGLLVPSATSEPERRADSDTQNVAAQNGNTSRPSAAPTISNPDRRNVDLELGLIAAIESTLPGADNVHLGRRADATFGYVAFSLEGRRHTVHGYVADKSEVDPITCAALDNAESCETESAGHWSFSAAVQADDSGNEYAVIYGSSSDRTAEITVLPGRQQLAITAEQLLSLAVSPEVRSALQLADTSLSSPAGIETPTRAPSA